MFPSSCEILHVFLLEIQLEAIDLLGGAMRARRFFSTEKKPLVWNCNRFLPWFQDIQPHLEDTLIIVNSTLPRHFPRFWEKGLRLNFVSMVLAKTTICADGGANRLYDFWEEDQKRAR
jgi:hypothetical protein